MNFKEIKNIIQNHEELIDYLVNFIVKISNIEYENSYLYYYKNLIDNFDNYSNFTIEIKDKEELVNCYWEDNFRETEYHSCSLKQKWFDLSEEELKLEIIEEIKKKIEKEKRIKETKATEQHNFEYELYLKLKDKFE